MAYVVICFGIKLKSAFRLYQVGKTGVVTDMQMCIYNPNYNDKEKTVCFVFVPIISMGNSILAERNNPIYLLKNKHPSQGCNVHSSTTIVKE